MTKTISISTFKASQPADFATHVAARFGAIDVAAEKLGSRVLVCSDEWFASAANLIRQSSPVRRENKFTEAGAWYDGWETRRHNPEEYDWVIINLGVSAAHIVGCEVDTAFFDGNHAPQISVDALYDTDTQDVTASNMGWEEVISKVECGPSQKHFFLRNEATERGYNYVKLKMYPDGGIARFRLYGRVVPVRYDADPCHPIINLCAATQGAVVLTCSDQHFGLASNILLPGRGYDMSDGWETRRSRTKGHTDWVIVRLAKRSKYLERAIIDTAHYRGNFPKYIQVHGIDTIDTVPESTDPQWVEIVPILHTGPDKEHEYIINKAASFTHVKITIVPDGGIKRLLLWGY